MNGKIVGGFLVVTALIGGAAMYWLQEYAYYAPVVFAPGDEIRLTPLSGPPEAILVESLEGIDATSSPLGFRACFRTPLTLALLSETYKLYEKPVPLIAPNWFDCFDAIAIGAALEAGDAVAFLGQADVAPGIDRVIAVFADGRAFAWHQLAPDAEK